MTETAAPAPAVPDAEELDRYREVQRLAYDCAEAVAGALEPGITERQAAAMLRQRLYENGVHDWFHLPFAWFGDRTAFVGFRFPHQFFPTGRKLAEGMPFILDCAPVLHGYTSDIGYSGNLGGNPIQERLMADLEEYRVLVLDGVRRGKTLLRIYQDVDALIAKHGYHNRHRAYPFGVIAHRVGRLPETRFSPHVAGFGVHALRGLAKDALHGHREGWSPLWSPYRVSDHPPTPGLWAVEPHLGWRGVGAKFEELLVVGEDGEAAWLDDDLPHVRRWETAR